MTEAPQVKSPAAEGLGDVFFLGGYPLMIKHGKARKSALAGRIRYWLVVWNIVFLHILGMSSSQLTNIFQRGRYTTNQHINDDIIINYKWRISRRPRLMSTRGGVWSFFPAPTCGTRTWNYPTTIQQCSTVPTVTNHLGQIDAYSFPRTLQQSLEHVRQLAVELNCRTVRLSIADCINLQGFWFYCVTSYCRYCSLCFTPYKIPLNHHKIPLNHYKIPLNHYKIPLNPITRGYFPCSSRWTRWEVPVL